MTIQHRVNVAGVVALAGFLIFAGYGWLQEHDARLKAETQTGQQQKQIEEIGQQQASTQQALDVELRTLEQERAHPATAAQVVSDTSRLVPSLPEALRVDSGPANSALPDGPVAEAVVIPQADFKSLHDAELTCEENSAKLNACQTLQEDGQQQLKLTEAQRDEWKSAAKGGSLWHRAIGAAKWFAVGAGTGAAAYAIVHHK